MDGPQNDERQDGGEADGEGQAHEPRHVLFRGDAGQHAAVVGGVGGAAGRRRVRVDRRTGDGALEGTEGAVDDDPEERCQAVQPVLVGGTPELGGLGHEALAEAGGLVGLLGGLHSRTYLSV